LIVKTVSRSSVFDKGFVVSLLFDKTCLGLFGWESRRDWNLLGLVAIYYVKIKTVPLKIANSRYFLLKLA